MKILTKEDIVRIKERGSSVDEDKVRPIIEDVKKNKDSALIKYAEKYDRVRVSSIKVSDKEIKEAYSKVDSNVVDAINASIKNVKKYHEIQMPKEWMEDISEGVKAGQLVRPLDSIGCYVPGGNYPLVSTVIMTVIPARVAGVKEIVVCSPPEIDPAILVAADMCGATEIYKAGGSQAIAAMAYGTETVKKVNKIVGPGNIYVTAAKKIVYGDCGIDFIAGPSEIMIVADENNNPKYIAADMLSQAEHDKFASSILVTTSEKLVKEVNNEIEKQLDLLPTKEIAKASLENFGGAIIVKDIDEAFDVVNEFAPEHLEIMIDDEKLLSKVKNAGAVFFGEYSVEAAGDYCSGPNHVLPTNQFAKVRGGLSVMDFLKMPTVQKISKKGLLNLSKTIITLANVEGLDAHKKSVEVRDET